MSELEIIVGKNGETIAIIIRAEFEPKESQFITPESALQNVGFIKYRKGHEVKAHYHPAIERKISGTPEVVTMKSGKMRLMLYDHDQEFLRELIVKQGDTFLLISGGHAEEMLEDTTVFVVKQGPYLGPSDKVHFPKVPG